MENFKRVDFHVHYNPANEQTAYEAIDIAVSRNIIAMTVLARSQISPNYDSFIEYGKNKGVEIVPGIEFMARTKNGKSVDLILLGFDPNNDQIVEYFGTKYSKLSSKENNSKLALHQKKFLESQGFVFEDLDEEKKLLLHKLTSGELNEKAFNFCWIAASLPKNFGLTEELKEKFPDIWDDVYLRYSNLPNYKDDIYRLNAKFMYLVYFDVGKPGYIEVRTEVGKIFNVVHKAGGVALYSPEGGFSLELWQELIANGIDGIMAWHAAKLGMNGNNLPDIPSSVIKHCVANKLLVLGGSDYQQLDWQVGIGNGNLFNSPRRYVELENYIKEKNMGLLPWK